MTPYIDSLEGMRRESINRIKESRGVGFEVGVLIVHSETEIRRRGREEEEEADERSDTC